MNIEIFIIENTQVNQLKPPNRQCNNEALFIPILDETNKWLKLYIYFVSFSLGQLWPDLQSCHGFSVLSFIQQRKDPRIQSEKIYRRFQFPRMSLKVLIKIFLGSAKLSVNKFISDETFSLSFSQTFLLFHLEHCEKYFANFGGILKNFPQTKHGTSLIETATARQQQMIILGSFLILTLMKFCPYLKKNNHRLLNKMTIFSAGFSPR